MKKLIMLLVLSVSFARAKEADYTVRIKNLSPTEALVVVENTTWAPVSSNVFKGSESYKVLPQGTLKLSLTYQEAVHVATAKGVTALKKFGRAPVIGGQAPVTVEGEQTFVPPHQMPRKMIQGLHATIEKDGKVSSAVFMQ